MTTASAPTAIGLPDSKSAPNPADVIRVVGKANLKELDAFSRWLEGSYPAATHEWRFSAQSGWHEIPSIKKRRLLYFIPKQGDFRVSLIIGEKAVGRLKQGPLQAEFQGLLKEAKCYPEGIAFTLDKVTLRADLLIAMIEAKLAN